MRRFAVLVVSAVAALGLLGCSDDEPVEPQAAGSADTSVVGFEAFCAEYRDISESVLETTDLTATHRIAEKTDEVREQFAALPDLAPEELHGPIETLDAAIAEMDSIAGLIFVTGASRDARDDIAEWVIVNCRFDPATLAELG